MSRSRGLDGRGEQSSEIAIRSEIRDERQTNRLVTGDPSALTTGSCPPVTAGKTTAASDLARERFLLFFGFPDDFLVAEFPGFFESSRARSIFADSRLPLAHRASHLPWPRSACEHVGPG